MSTLTFDTLKYAERLRAAGVPEQQAKAEAEALRDVLSEALESTLATKSDVQQVVHRMDVFDAKIDKLSWMMGILIALAIANFAKQFF
jgi:hypothetical protein